MMTYVLLFLANIGAGTINVLAGGGGLITFPLLMLTLAPVTADATNAVALFFAYPAGIGILMIGALSFISRGDIRHVVALKTF
jgi:uncharacterized membrane protein YfcA